MHTCKQLLCRMTQVKQGSMFAVRLSNWVMSDPARAPNTICHTQLYYTYTAIFLRDLFAESLDCTRDWSDEQNEFNAPLLVAPVMKAKVTKVKRKLHSKAAAKKK